MQNIKVAIIDSGVNKKHNRFANDKIYGFGYQNKNVIEEYYDTYGHGTAVYNIIRNTNQIDIINIKVFGIENGVSSRDIIEILDYINQNLDVNIINLSLGLSICEDLNELNKICEKLSNKGVIIVSAFDNSGSISYPAAFDNVIGVTTGNHCRKINDFEYINDNIINIAGYGNLQRVAWNGPDYIFIGGNSFACAHVTAQVANFMVNGITGKSEILEQFKSIAIQQYEVKRKEMKSLLFDIKKACIFPFNKEMHSLIRFTDLLDFQITSVYDCKYSPVIGAATDHILQDNTVKKVEIQNIDNIKWDEFDTLILGHLDELSAHINKLELKEKLIREALRNGKKIYAFDNISDFVTEDNKKDIYFPIIDKQDLPPLRFGKLYRISKPVLGVFGTSSKQGKFTLQLILRKLLLNKGYQVGQLGTEPSSLLFNMDYVYPMGYNNTVYIKEFECIRYLNYIMNEMCIKNDDIILVGSQSGSVNYDTGNITMFNIPQYNFLMGTQPDKIVLCVNPYDETEYIKRTIKFLESSIDCQVIALVIFPLDIIDNWAGIYGRKKRLDDNSLKLLKEKNLLLYKIPSFILGKEDDMNQLVDCIINEFSE